MTENMSFSSHIYQEIHNHFETFSHQYVQKASEYIAVDCYISIKLYIVIQSEKEDFGKMSVN
jgi:hypothetical protein